MNVSITSVAKRKQRRADAPAAIDVIDNEDLRRSGATTLADALRMAPGLSVAQYKANQWIITSRGFAEEFSGKLLVLIDGRSVYTPGDSGVHWDVQNPMLEDVERIEIIRGPGATLWGANAVNGVVNVITKNAMDTQGGLVTGSGGNAQDTGAVRFGGKVNRAGTAAYRVFAQYNRFGELADFDGDDSGRYASGGFRIDWDAADAGRDLLTLHGDLYQADMGDRFKLISLTAPYESRVPDTVEADGANIVARWSHTFSEQSRASVQIYYDQWKRRSPRLTERWDTYDIELQHEVALADWNQLTWGAGYRLTSVEVEDSLIESWSDDSPSADLFNFFVQNETRLFADHLALTLGSKFERHYFDEWEVQPSGRFLWKPHENHSVWGAVSRAVRAPNFSQNYERINLRAFDWDGSGPGLPRLVSIFPNPDVRSETAVAYELGYRLQPHARAHLDLSAFYSEYDGLEEETELPFFVESTPPPTHGVIGDLTANAMHGRTYGVEIAPVWHLTPQWHLSAAYSLLRMNLRSETPEREEEVLEGDSPRHQLNLRSYLQLPGGVSFDAFAYYVDRLPNQDIPSCLRLDLRLGWRASESLELSAGVRNLLDGAHAEFRGREPEPRQIERSVYGTIRWTF